MSAPKTTQLINGLWKCSETEYHADSEWVSNSDLKLFRDSIPRYHGLRIAKTIQPDDDSSARALGTAVHACLLQPDKVNDLFLQWPAGDGKTAEVKRAREAVCRDAGCAADPKVRTFNGRTIVTVKEWETANRMADAARQHPLVKEMIDMPGYCEQAVRVESPEFGKMKSRFDKLFATGHILEIKSTRRLHPEAFSRDVHTLGYHRQAAFYEDVRDLAMGSGPGVFVFAVICSIEPYETVVYSLEEKARDLGRLENYQLLAELRDRRERNDWSSRWATVQRLDLPYYAYPKEQR
jgi:hypothetical protein